MRDLVTVITGAAHGIGAATASAFAGAGARLVLVDVDADGVGARARQLDAVAVAADVSTMDGASAAAEAALGAYGRIDVLVNNAARYTVVPLHEATEADWDDTVAGVLRPVFTCTRAVLPAMIGAGRGAIVNVASVNQIVAAPHHAAYTAAKGAVAALTRQLAVEYGPSGIRCNSVSPGLIVTERIEPGLTDDDRRHGTQAYPVRHFGRPEDVAAAVLFLATATFVNGVDLPVDGGLTVLSPATLVSPGLRRRWNLPPLVED